MKNFRLKPFLDGDELIEINCGDTIPSENRNKEHRIDVFTF